LTDDRRNFFLFVAIAALILLGWPLAQQKFFPTANPPATKIVDGKSRPVANPAADPTADGPAAIRDRKLVLGESPRVRIVTPRLQGSINLKGARIDDLVLVDYKETIAKDSAPIRLLSPAGAPEAYFAGFGWQGQGLNPPAADTVWKASAGDLSPGHPVTLDAANASGQRFRIELAVDANYMFTVKQTVLNAGAQPVAVAAYGLVNRTGVSKDAATWQSHTGPMSVHDNGADYSLKFKDVDAAAQHFSSTGGWLGFADKYWLTALVPDQGRGFDGQFRAGANQAYQADYTSNPVRLAPGQAASQTSRFFAGAKEVKTLQAYEEQGVPKLDKAIDWGWFEIVEKPIFHYLDWLFHLVGNFGIAIILLTLTIRGLMFPIAQKQFASMAAMKVIQPKMKAIQERYKDDKVRQQQEVMALYKSEGANPLAGCLPTLIQIPIFYALYKVLVLSIEMRHQPFALWIKDLSAPDPLTPVNLFGFLPFDPPGFLHLGVLAILLGITMYFQFKLNPQTGMDPSTKQVMGLMPWIMMFFFAPFAAGLQLYYVASNCLTILQQRWLYARHPALKASAAA
jgi:YidC/Oxa1 family membrane protein insertase